MLIVRDELDHSPGRIRSHRLSCRSDDLEVDAIRRFWGKRAQLPARGLPDSNFRLAYTIRFFVVADSMPDQT